MCSALLVALGYALWLPFHHSTTQALVNLAIALSSAGSIKDPVKGHAPLGGCLVVWSICAAAALLAALALRLMPRPDGVRRD